MGQENHSISIQPVPDIEKQGIWYFIGQSQRTLIVAFSYLQLKVIYLSTCFPLGLYGVLTISYALLEVFRA